MRDGRGLLLSKGEGRETTTKKKILFDIVTT
jgi:hypothetical protein